MRAIVNAPWALILLAVLLAPVVPSPAVAQDPQCVDINSAGFEELQRIIHIGPERAEQIIELRAVRLFTSIDDMARIRGIAAARIRDIREQGIACAVLPDDAAE